MYTPSPLHSLICILVEVLSGLRKLPRAFRRFRACVTVKLHAGPAGYRPRALALRTCAYLETRTRFRQLTKDEADENGRDFPPLRRGAHLLSRHKVKN